MSPLARAVRTFLAGASAVLASVVTVDWLTDWRVGAVAVALGLITSLVAAVIAYATAFTSVAPTTTLGKALFTFWQWVAAGLGTVVIADLTEAALIDFGTAVLRIVIGGAVAALATLALNGSEESTTSSGGRGFGIPRADG